MSEPLVLMFSPLPMTVIEGRGGFPAYGAFQLIFRHSSGVMSNSKRSVRVGEPETVTVLLAAVAVRPVVEIYWANTWACERVNTKSCDKRCL